MNSTGNNNTAEVIDGIVQQYYETYVCDLALIGSIALLFYSILLKLSQEVQHIWCKPLTLPSLFYVLAKYGTLIGQVLSFMSSFMSTGNACNILFNATNAMSTFSYIGVQGLLVARAYSICRGAKIPSIALALSFLTELVLILYLDIAFHGCIENYSAENILIAFISCINGICTDVLIFGICLWKVWGTWKLKRETGIEDRRSLVSVLLNQIISRFCFVILITVTASVVTLTETSSDLSIEQSLSYFQNALSALLVADFTLDLRRQNEVRIEASNLTLPSLHISNVLQHVHQSVLVELGADERCASGVDNEVDDDFPEDTGELRFARQDSDAF